MSDSNPLFLIRYLYRWLGWDEEAGKLLVDSIVQPPNPISTIHMAASSSQDNP